MWSKNYGGEFQDECQSVRQTSDFGYVMTGFLTSPISNK